MCMYMYVHTYGCLLFLFSSDFATWLFLILPSIRRAFHFPHFELSSFSCQLLAAKYRTTIYSSMVKPNEEKINSLHAEIANEYAYQDAHHSWRLFLVVGKTLFNSLFLFHSLFPLASISFPLASISINNFRIMN